MRTNKIRFTFYAFKLIPFAFLTMIVLEIINIIAGVISIYSIEQVFFYSTSLISNTNEATKFYMFICIYAFSFLMSGLYLVIYKRYIIQFILIPSFERKTKMMLHDKCAQISSELFEEPSINSKLFESIHSATNLFRLTESFISLIFSLLMIVTITIYISSFNAFFLLLMLFSPIHAILKHFFGTKRWMKTHDEMNRIALHLKEYEKAMMTKEAVSEMRVAHAFNVIFEKYKESLKKKENLDRKNQKAELITSLSLLPLSLIGEIGAITLGLVLLYFDQIRVEQFAASISAYFILLSSYNELGETIGYYNMFSSMVRPYFDFMHIENRDGNYKNDKNKPEANVIELKNVYFKYRPSFDYVLKKINLKINSGDIVAIVGENGSGKTTLLNILNGTYLPSKGQSFFNGVNVKEYRESDLYSQTTIVSQQFAKYKMTILDNIEIGDAFNHNENKAEMHFKNFCKFDGINLQTKLGIEFNGKDLSGGQWQRLAIARGFYKNSNLVFLDEPTSAIDPIEENRVYLAFAKLLKGKTGCIVTHRLGSIKLANKIIVMDKGEIIEMGTHKELLAKQGAYHHMWKSQSDLFL